MGAERAAPRTTLQSFLEWNLIVESCGEADDRELREANDTSLVVGTLVEAGCAPRERLLEEEKKKFLLVRKRRLERTNFQSFLEWN